MRWRSWWGRLRTYQVLEPYSRRLGALKSSFPAALEPHGPPSPTDRRRYNHPPCPTLDLCDFRCRGGCGGCRCRGGCAPMRSGVLAALGHPPLLEIPRHVSGPWWKRRWMYASRWPFGNLFSSAACHHCHASTHLKWHAQTAVLRRRWSRAEAMSLLFSFSFLFSLSSASSDGTR